MPSLELFYFMTMASLHMLFLHEEKFLIGSLSQLFLQIQQQLTQQHFIAWRFDYDAVI